MCVGPHRAKTNIERNTKGEFFVCFWTSNPKKIIPIQLIMAADILSTIID
jgi:hypothetical protein